MKKIVFIALSILGVQSLIAQETETTTAPGDKEVKTWYVSIGAAIMEDYKINKNLADAGMPQIGNEALEITIGRSVMYKKLLMDLEWNTNYMDNKTATDRVKTVNSGINFRVNYVAFQNDKFFLSGGADFSYMFNYFNLYSRSNTIDLNDLNPSTHTGHINLNNSQFYMGPSVVFGALQNTKFPLRLNMGYEWALYSSKWKSEVADVANSFRENGQGRFYVKLSIPIQ